MVSKRKHFSLLNRRQEDYDDNKINMIMTTLLVISNFTEIVSELLPLWITVIRRSSSVGKKKDDG